MRIDHYTFPGVRWRVWHVPTCRALLGVLWVDDETHQYGVLEQPLRVVEGALVHRIEQARRIDVNPSAALILIDPLQDDEPATELVGEGVAASPVDASAALESHGV